MPKIGFNTLAAPKRAGDVQRRYVSGPGGSNARPLVVGEQLSAEPVSERRGFADIDRIPIAVRGEFAEDVDTGMPEVVGSDGVQLKAICRAADAGRVH